MLQTFTQRLSMLSVAASAYLLTQTNMVLAQATGGGNANIRGALETNQEALAAVEDSTFTGEGVQEAAQNVTNAVLYAVGAIGIIMVSFGIWNLYKHYSEGEQSRGSAATGITMIAVGGLMTIAAIVTAVFPNLLVGAS